MIDAAGHLGYLLVFVGTLAIAQKKHWGFFLRMCGDTIWMCLGVKLALTSIWSWGVIFVIVDMYGYLMWQNDSEINRR